MAPTTKKSTTPAVAPVVVAATTTLAEKKPKTPKAVVATATPVATPVVAAPVVVAAEVEATATTATSAMEELATKFAALFALMKETQASLKVLSKEYERMKKTVNKSERKRANARTNPNGFAKPALITEALCEFLAVPKGTEMSRTAVTRKINAYIKEHNLNKPENKRIILPDEKLRKILGVKPTEEVSFFSLQRFLSPLFVKKTAVAAA